MNGFRAPRQASKLHSKVRVSRRASLVLLAATLLLAPVLAPATIEEQRARLPPPAFCQDPVVGVWRAHRFSPTDHDWTVFTLTVRRDQSSGPTALVGTIDSESWTGTTAQAEPPPCTSGVLHWNIGMTAAGWTDGSNFEFHGTRWWIKRRDCVGWPGYNLDRFTGTIDPRLQEFQTVNNDGGREVNEPYVFRRVRCLDEPTAKPPSIVVAPPIAPPSRARGCAR